MAYQLQKTTGAELNGVKASDALGMYFDRKISWVELAMVMDALGPSPETDPGLALDEPKRRRIRRMMQAYRLLKGKRPDYIEGALKKAGTWVPNPEALNYLLVLYRENKEEPKARNALLLDTIDKVISGKIIEKQIRILVRKQRSGARGAASASVERDGTDRKQAVVTPDSKNQGDPKSVAAAESALKSLNFILDTALERNSYRNLRAVLGAECRAMSTRLSCIADEEFLKMWRKRKVVDL